MSDTTMTPAEIAAQQKKDAAEAARSPSKPKPKRLKKARAKKGSDLLPDFSSRDMVLVRHWFWLGILPTLSDRSHLSVAGIAFPASVDKVITRKRQGTEHTRRIPTVGQCIPLSKAQIDLLREQLPYCIYRFIDPPREDIQGVGDGIEALDEEPRRGHAIRVYTPESIEARRAAGQPANEYVPEEWDEPLADYLFCIPCENQKRPKCGDEFPEPVSVTGLEWPKGK